MHNAKSAPLVAIVTPVYNGATYLAETMENVQSLDYPNLVHVILDNASLDRTPEIVRQYTDQKDTDRKVPILSTRNSTTLPMETNWSKAVGLIPREAKYFWLLCADDTLATHAIRRTVCVAEGDPSVVLVGSLWRTDNAVVGEELPSAQTIFDGKYILRSYLRREHAALAGMNKLVRCSMIDEGCPYYGHNGVVMSTDTEANMRACLRGNFGFVHEELYYWRSHAESMTMRVSRDMKLFEADWPLLLDRYGPHVLSYREYRECRQRFRRYLLRRVLLACLRVGGRKTFAWHMDLLRKRGDPATLRDFAGALWEWCYLLLTGRRYLVGRPGQPETEVASGVVENFSSRVQ
jgi:glycosyltransferase involved in cell wall biosynthesis